MLMGLVWAALGGSLLLATEYLHDTVSKYAAAVLCRCCTDYVTVWIWLLTVGHLRKLLQAVTQFLNQCLQILNLSMLPS